MDELNDVPGIFFTGDRVRLAGVGLFFADSPFAGQSGTVTAKDDLEDQYRVTLDNGARVWAYHSEIEHLQ